MKPRIRQLLLDFDGVLAQYRHELRIGHLAAFSGAEHERVRAVLFASGLETEYDGGAIDTATYLARLGDGLGATIDEAAWIASRLAGSTADEAVLAHLAGIDAGVALGVLTNNGALMMQAIPQVVAPLSARLDGRVLCSGALGVRKPDVAVYRQALDRLGWDAAGTLFVDDVFANVQGARKAGLHAEIATDARSLGKVLKRYIPDPQPGW